MCLFIFIEKNTSGNNNFFHTVVKLHIIEEQDDEHGSQNNPEFRHVTSIDVLYYSVCVFEPFVIAEKCGECAQSFYREHIFFGMYILLHDRN